MSVLKIERLLLQNPIVNPNDTEKYDPIDDVVFGSMESEYFEDTSRFHLHIFYRKDADMNPYWDLYIWDCMLYPDNYHRFIIQNRLFMPIEDEELFIKYTSNVEQTGRWNNREVDVLYREVKPEMETEYHNGNQIGRLIQAAYYMELPCIRGILYKEKLDVIAFNIDKIPDTNLIGSTPVEIIGHGVNLKILKILNNVDLVHVLFSEEKLEKSIEIYKHYLGYIGADLPNVYQCSYLQMLYESRNLATCIKFNRALYRKLKEVSSWYEFNLYKEFMELKDNIPIKIKIPTIDDLAETVSRMEIMSKYVSVKSELDEFYEKRAKEAKYRYESEKFLLRMPLNIFDVCKEANAQGNCLLNGGYVERHALGETTIVFVREKERPNHSFVTMEIKDDCIIQIYGKYNSLPTRDVYEFVEKFSRSNWIRFNPDKLIGEVIDYDYDELTEELEEYLESYRRRHFFTISYADEGENNYVQLTFEDVYTELINDKE